MLFTGFLKKELIMLKCTVYCSIKKTCLCCDIEFELTHRSQKYCTYKCANKHRIRRNRFKNSDRELGSKFVDKRIKPNYQLKLF